MILTLQILTGLTANILLLINVSDINADLSSYKRPIYKNNIRKKGMFFAI